MTTEEIAESVDGEVVWIGCLDSFLAGRCLLDALSLVAVMNESPEIVARRTWLHEYAKRLRYEEELDSFPDGTKPDVLRAENDGEDHYLFVGVVYEPESSPDAVPIELVRRCLVNLGALVGKGVVRGGRVVVVTGTQDEADVWAAMLNETVRKIGWKSVTFGVRNIDRHWVAIW